jgi:hypothetical protein
MTTPKTPGEELREGLGHLFRAAKGFARELNRDRAVATVEKTMRDGATELVRAVASVGRRVSDELEKNFVPPSQGDAPREPADAARDDEREHDDAGPRTGEAAPPPAPGGEPRESLACGPAPGASPASR